MPAIHQTEQLDCPRAAEIDKGVERGPDCPPRVEHVVDENHRPIRDVDGHRRRTERPRRPLVDVVPIEGDVQLTERHRRVLELLNALLHAASEGNPTGAQADEHQLLDPRVALNDLVCQARNRTANVVGVQQLLVACFGQGHTGSFAVSQGRT
jgi:hypothetical protein